MKSTFHEKNARLDYNIMRWILKSLKVQISVANFGLLAESKISNTELHEWSYTYYNSVSDDVKVLQSKHPEGYCDRITVSCKIKFISVI